MLKNLGDETFQQKFEKFKEKWLKESAKRTSERVIFKEVTFENKTPQTLKSQIESLTSTGRWRNTIKPAFMFNKSDKLSNYSAKVPGLNPRTLFTNQEKVNKSDRISDAAKKPIRLPTHYEVTSKLKRKCKSARNERYEKLLKLQNAEGGSKSSSESSILIQNSRSNLVSNNYSKPKRKDVLDSYDYHNEKNENIHKASLRPSSFHLRSPKLFLNDDEPNTWNQNSDTSLTVDTVNDFEIESSDDTSSKVSFSARRVGLENKSIVDENQPQMVDSLRNDPACTCNDQIYSQTPKIQHNKILSWLLPSNNISECDTTSFSDDDTSSVGCSPICNGMTLASALLENTSVTDSDVEMKMNNFMMLPTKSRSCSIHESRDAVHNQPDFSLNSFMKEENHCFSPNYERNLPFKKRQMQWCTFLDSLESALTTSMEKLDEIKNDL